MTQTPSIHGIPAVGPWSAGEGEQLSEPLPEWRYRHRVRPVAMLRELWSARPVIQALSERELRSRYKQTKMGFAWAFLTPLILMFVFTVFFKRAANVDSGGVPYPLFSYLALVPWTFFSNAVSRGGLSLTVNMALLNKVRCPREVFPISAIGVAAVDAAIATLVLGLLFAIYQVAPGPEVVWVPALLAVQVLFTLGVTLLVAITTVYMRDVRQVLPMALQMGLFATPIAYGIDIIPERWQVLYSIMNPLAPVIDGYRATFLMGEAPRLDLLGPAAFSATALAVIGFVMFKRFEVSIADVA